MFQGFKSTEVTLWVAGSLAYYICSAALVFGLSISVDLLLNNTSQVSSSADHAWQCRHAKRCFEKPLVAAGKGGPEDKINGPNVKVSSNDKTDKCNSYIHCNIYTAALVCT